MTTSKSSVFLFVLGFLFYFLVFINDYDPLLTIAGTIFIMIGLVLYINEKDKEYKKVKEKEDAISG